MRKFIALFLSIVAARELKDDFSHWKGMFDKKYESAEEHVRRMNIWAENLAIVNTHNAEAAAGKHTYALKMNKFADMTSEEYQKTMLGYKPSAVRNKEILKLSSGSAPASWDWRARGVVTHVKNQAQCGSCWAFSAVAAMEGRFNIKNNGTMPSKCSSTCGPNKAPCCSFSEQELVDCTDNGADTCNRGGDPRQGILEIAKHMQGTANTEKQYPYTSAAGKTTGKCHATTDGVQTGIIGAVSVPEGDEEALKAASHETVVSIGIDASKTSFQLYSHGVYLEPKCSSTELDHGVAIVGYGSFGPTPGPSPPPSPSPVPPPSPSPSPAPGPWDCINNDQESACAAENGCHWCTSLGGWCSNAPCLSGGLEATTAGTGDYWIVRNSWGAEWGQDGYIFMARNRDNQCGVASDANIAKIAQEEVTSDVIV
jgi:cathepsin L|mmetsp:Transcript_34000/g.54195  ORF Transcript_34000/g.54195 Transcript_34000/m.54195 type:complete len:426 (+) Transcript_34000:62-1339(+)|eukprot:CAMPEP_0169107312 /NCGR_PEP_ID=MMETSP1015-20121227/24813_1 /TAXON_ID=342587 /ORGANISM="Karlodinium micrum, Strain CCMP2283" /LENGTH=425 /DNA_ID=CAMNT_0009168831 /DNA_START=34 /DNA_END=1311 /DNA_ORIENTATION=-